MLSLFLRFIPMALSGLAVALFGLIFALQGGAWAAVLALLAAGLLALGLRDLLQTRHAVLRNYPILGHVRYFFEMIRPEIRQYLLESDEEEVPFSRETRAIVYQRSKNVEDKRAFGTKKRVNDAGYQWITH